jgi:hypothetical protein
MSNMKICNPLYPIYRRMETGNSLCFTSKRINYSVSNETVFKIINSITINYRVPCILLPYIKELQENLDTMDIKSAIRKTLQDNNLTIQRPIKNIRRYIYPQAPFVEPIKLINYFKDTFILNVDEEATQDALAFIDACKGNGTYNSTYNFSYDSDIFTPIVNDASYISVVNNDGKSFSSTTGASINTYFGKNVIFKNVPIINGNFNSTYTPTTVICNNVSQKNNFVQFGIIILSQLTNEGYSQTRAVYIPFVVNSLYAFYKTFRPANRIITNQSVTFKIIPNFIPYITEYTTKLILKTFASS